MNEQLRSLDHVKASAIDMAVKFGPKLLVAITIMAAGYMVARWVGQVVDRLLHRFKLEPPVRSLLVRVAQLVVLPCLPSWPCRIWASNCCR